MKKIFIILVVTLLGLFGCSNANNLDQLELSQNNYTISIGEVIYLDTNASKLKLDNIEWSSGNDLVATVDQGIVTGVGVGSVFISVTAGELSAEVRIIVEANVESKLNITGKQSVLVEGSVLLEIENLSTISNIEWTSSDEEIATVNNGQVTGVKAGIVTIKASLINDTSIYGEYLIYVYDKETDLEQLINTIKRTTFEFEGEFDFSTFSKKIVDSVHKIGNAFVGVGNYTQSGPLYDLQSIGSGIIYNQIKNDNTYTYYVLTNHHVIEEADQIRVYLGYLDDEIIGNVVKSDAILDLAIVEFEFDIAIDPVVIATKAVITGEFIIAIGNPTGFDYFGSVTFGIVSHPERYVGTSGNETKQKYIQHDAAINSGNSGGPLLNIDGELVGINTLKLVDLSVEGMGFAIPLDVIIKYIE